MSIALRSGWEAFDELGLVAPGRVLLLEMGTRAAEALVMGLLGACGRERRALVVGGAGGAFHVPRGATASRWRAVVEEALPRALRQAGAPLVLVTGLSGSRAGEGASGVLAALRTLARRHEVPIVVVARPGTLPADEVDDVVEVRAASEDALLVRARRRGVAVLARRPRAAPALLT